MRVLVATTANTGHFEPLVPFARACAGAGHDVLVAAPEGFAADVGAAGFAHLPFGEPPPEATGAVFARLPGLDGATVEDIEAGNAEVAREVFARLDAGAALPAMTEAMAQWRPDVVLREPAEFASYVAAEAAGVPHVQLNVSVSAFLDLALVVEEPLVAMGARPGLPGLRSAPRLTLMPASVDGEPPPGSPTPVRFRDGATDVAAAPLPDWWPDADGPVVYVTFGTVAANLGLFPELYERVVAGLADLPVRALVTTGRGADPAALGALPPNVHVEQFWPQREVMPHASVMVAHGGSGTMLLALAHGVPMVMLPLFADQPTNAARVQEAGAGLVASGGPPAVEQVPGLVTRVLADPAVRDSARSVAAEMAALPPVPRAVEVLEQVASTTMGV